MDEIELERLSDDERAELSALPKTRMPDASLEERAVIALRERGLLRPVAVRPGRSSRPWRSLVAAAAAIVMFAGGVLVGQRLEASEVTGNDVARGGSGADAALGVEEVQRASDVFVAALARAGEMSASADPRVQAEVREIAVHGLRAAAGVVARIAPDEPVAGEIFRGFARIETEAAVPGDGAGVRHVVWF